MKQLAFLIAATLLALVGSFYDPFWGILLYYGLALLRPQHLWKWALPSADAHWSLIAAAIALLGAVFHAPRLLTRLRGNPVVALLVVLGVFLFLSCMTAYDPETAQTWGIEYAKILFMGLLASLLIREVWHIQALAIMTLVALGYVAYEFNYNYLVDHRLDIFLHGFGNLDNNGAGLMLAMGLPFAYVFGITARRLWCRAAALLLGVLLMHAVMMSYSRGAMVSGLVGLGWLLLRTRRRLQAVAFIVALAVVVPLLAGPQIRQRFFSTAQYESDRSANSRLDSWAAAWRMTLDKPFFGHGIRNSNAYSYKYGADREGRTIHSQYLQIAADSGLPAIITYVALLALALYLLGRNRALCLDRLAISPPLSDKARRDVEQLAALSGGFQASLLIFTIGASFLSVEVFELPWLLMVVAGVLGHVTRSNFETLPGGPEPAPLAGRGPGGGGPRALAHPTLPPLVKGLVYR